MMGLSHESAVGIAKSFGLFYLIAMFIGICVYAFWPRNRDRFDRAKHSILDDEDGPLEQEDRR